MPTAEVAHALHQSAVTHQLDTIRRRYEEESREPFLHCPVDLLDEGEISSRLLMLQDRLAGHLRSRSPALVRDDAEVLGTLALQLLLQTQPQAGPSVASAKGGT